MIGSLGSHRQPFALISAHAVQLRLNRGDESRLWIQTEVPDVNRTRIPSLRIVRSEFSKHYKGKYHVPFFDEIQSPHTLLGCRQRDFRTTGSILEHDTIRRERRAHRIILHECYAVGFQRQAIFLLLHEHPGCQDLAA